MKYRKGFVTNSSSSSFIIAIKEDIPEEFKKYLTPLTKTNILQKLMYEGYCDCYDTEKITDDLTQEEEKELLNVNDEIYLLLKLSQNSNILETYLKALKYFKDNDKPLYYYAADWDWEHYHNDLREFVRNQTIIETDY